VACKQEYDYRVKFIHVVEEGPREIDGKLNLTFRPVMCRHCDEPPCAEACPEEAIKKREDGVVILDTDKCMGCRMCIEACPYDAVWFDEESEKAFKCNMCHHRIERGLMPACADNVCLAHCIYFGNPQEIDVRIRAKKSRRRISS
jgi:Fe-S-cluster-containing dehydrogenase component